MIVRIFAFVVFALLGSNVNAQEMFDVKNQSENNLKTFQDAIQKVAPDATFSKNQLVKLEKVFLDINKEKKELIQSGIHKHEYAEAVKVFNEKYESRINGILSSEQRIAFQKMKNTSSK